MIQGQTRVFHPNSRRIRGTSRGGTFSYRLGLEMVLRSVNQRSNIVDRVPNGIASIVLVTRHTIEVCPCML